MDSNLESKQFQPSQDNIIIDLCDSEDEEPSSQNINITQKKTTLVMDSLDYNSELSTLLPTDINITDRNIEQERAISELPHTSMVSVLQIRRTVIPGIFVPSDEKAFNEALSAKVQKLDKISDVKMAAKVIEKIPEDQVHITYLLNL